MQPPATIHRFECIAADGSRLTLDVDTPIGPVSGYVEFRMPNLGIRDARFVTAPLGYAERVVGDPDIASHFEFIDEYDYQGGRLRLGDGVPPPSEVPGDFYMERGPDGVSRPIQVLLGVWEGRYHGVNLLRYGTQVDRILSAFQLLSLNDLPEGVSIAPRRLADAFVTGGPGVIIDVPALGVVEVVELTARSNGSLPRHTGTIVPGGELYVSSSADNAREYFLLISATAVATIQPRHAPHVHSEQSYVDEDQPVDSGFEAELLRLLSTLRVSWTRTSDG